MGGPITDQSETHGRFGLTRRRLLVGGGSAVALLGGGGLYVASEFEGDFGDYTAPDSFPTVTTRGLVDPESTGETATAADDTATATAEIEGEWSFEEADELFLFVHGFATDDETARDQGYATRVGLEPLRPAPVATYSWDSDLDWEPAKAMADANAVPLAAWLADWAGADGRPVHLVGYSLGARVVCETLRVLTAAGTSNAIASVSLLGGAVPHDSVEQEGRYGEAIGAVDAPVTNFHNSDDRVLGWVYRLTDRTRAVGEEGIADPDAAPAGYTDVDVSSVPDHYSYFEPDEGCLPQLVDRL